MTPDDHAERAARRVLERLERKANARSILAIPDEQLPDQEARAELVRRALRGQDVYAYKPVGRPWVVWVRQAHPSQEARFDPAEWAKAWRRGEQ
jgi:hypothetical protein